MSAAPQSNRSPRAKPAKRDEAQRAPGVSPPRRRPAGRGRSRDAGDGPAPIRGYLYDAAGKDREVALTRGVIARLNTRAILWVDLPRRDAEELGELGRVLDLDPRTVRGLVAAGEQLRLDNYGRYLQFACLAAPSAAPSEETEEPSRFRRGRIDFLVGRKWVLTVHDGEAPYLEAFRAQDKGDTKTGALGAAAVCASLLDWHLGEYFAEVSRIERAIDELDERILATPSAQETLEDILATRRRSSRLRRALMAQRSVFYGLGRPDLGHVIAPEAAAAFAALASRFERAVDEAEHTRDLSVGSFELFTSRSAQQTNELVKALTFFTVIIGTTAAVAGLFGMNFDPPFFRTGSIGFFAVTLGLFVAGLGAWLVGRRRRWI